MAIVLPTFNPEAAHSLVEIGKYVLDSSTLAAPTHLTVKSTLKSNRNSSYVVRIDSTKVDPNDATSTVSISVYTVITGMIEDYTASEKIQLLDRIRAVLNDSNIARIERGER
jgi:hypothetical protein